MYGIKLWKIGFPVHASKANKRTFERRHISRKKLCFQKKNLVDILHTARSFTFKNCAFSLKLAIYEYMKFTALHLPPQVVNHLRRRFMGSR